jgi:NAD(P)-dependent dehydrogenase (short-subunit alcohol dehydrogenase family)
MEEFSLKGKKILVTGASSGIGKAASILISRYGGEVFITGRNHTRLQETYSQLTDPGNPSPFPAEASAKAGVSHHEQFPADLTIEQEMNDLIDRLPRLNGIVHSAGIVGPLPVKFITQADIDRMFTINFDVPVNLTARLLRQKKITDHASILFISTIATKNPYFGGGLYSSSKAALEAFSRTLALEMIPRGIRSNCLQAGLVDTPMIVNPSEDNMQQEALDRYLKRYPLGIGQPADMANAILFFLSDASKWITGTSLIMGGE